MDKTVFDRSIQEVMTVSEDWVSAQQVYEQLLDRYGRSTPSKKCVRNHMDSLVTRHEAERESFKVGGATAYRYRLIA